MPVNFSQNSRTRVYSANIHRCVRYCLRFKPKLILFVMFNNEPRHMRIRTWSFTTELQCTHPLTLALLSLHSRHRTLFLNLLGSDMFEARLPSLGWPRNKLIFQRTCLCWNWCMNVDLHYGHQLTHHSVCDFYNEMKSIDIFKKLTNFNCFKYWHTFRFVDGHGCIHIAQA